VDGWVDDSLINSRTYFLLQFSFAEGNADFWNFEQVGAREEVMTAVVRMLEQKWGSVEGYLLQVAGVKMGVIHKCKKVLKGELNGVC